MAVKETSLTLGAVLLQGQCLELKEDIGILTKKFAEAEDEVEKMHNALNATQKSLNEYQTKDAEVSAHFDYSLVTSRLRQCHQLVLGFVMISGFPEGK